MPAVKCSCQSIRDQLHWQILKELLWDRNCQICSIQVNVKQPVVLLICNFSSAAEASAFWVSECICISLGSMSACANVEKAVGHVEECAEVMLKQKDSWGTVSKYLIFIVCTHRHL